DAAVVLETGTVERDLRDALFLGARSQRRADLLGGLDVAGALQALDAVLLGRRRRDQRLAGVRRDDLCVDVLRRAIHGQPVRPERADVQARLLAAADANFFLDVHGLALLLLRFFEDHALVGVAHALA